MQAFRAATSSLSPRVLARSPAAVGRMPASVSRRTAMSARNYSDTTSSSSKDGVKESKEEAKPASEGEKNPCAEVETKLKAKEEEVVDLTVRHCITLYSLVNSTDTRHYLTAHAN